MSLADVSQLPGRPGAVAEPVFAEPWQAQAFALTLGLHASGAFSWREWTDALSEQVKSGGPSDDGSGYYEHWLAALESLLISKALLGPSLLDERKQAWAEAYRHTPHGQPVEL